jgi:hypothetical protein
MEVHLPLETKKVVRRLPLLRKRVDLPLGGGVVDSFGEESERMQ